MSRPLEEFVREARRLHRREQVFETAMQSLAAVLGLTLFASAVGSLTRPEAPFARLSLVVGLMAATGALLAILMRRAFRERVSNVELVRRMKRGPRAGDESMLAAVDFLRQPDDVSYGSVALRRRLIDSAGSRSAGFDPALIVDRGRLRTSMAALVAVVGVWLLVFGAAGKTAWSALRELASPFGSAAWPRRHYLRFVDAPAKLAMGADFSVALIDDFGRLPGDVQFYRRTMDEAGSSFVETIPLEGDSEKKIARLIRPSRSFEYWATGGDHRDMSPIRVEITEPVEIPELSILIHPPAYTGLPAYESSEAIRGLVGSTIELRGTLSRPARSAALQFADGHAVELALNDAATQFSLAPDPVRWSIARTESAQFSMVDRDGTPCVSQRRVSVLPVDDRPPTVELLEPAKDGFLTPFAKLPLRIDASDDLALAAIRPVVMRSGSSETELELSGWERGSEPVLDPVRRVVAGLPAAPETRNLAVELDIQSLGLVPGDEFTIVARASDHHSQTSSSASRRFEVVDRDEFVRRLQDELSSVTSSLGRALDSQRKARESVTRLQESARDRHRATDSTQRASTYSYQREVSLILAAPNDGAMFRLGTILQRLDRNGWKGYDVAQDAGRLLSSIAELHTQDVQPALDELTAWSQVPAATEAAGFLESCAQHQDRAILRLESLLARQAVRKGIQELTRELAEITARQRQLFEETSAAARDHLSSTDKPSRGDSVGAELARRQAELAHRGDRVGSGLAAARSGNEEDRFVDRASEAVALVRAQNLASRFSEATRRLRVGQMVEAALAQKGILETLEEMQAALTEVEDGGASDPTGMSDGRSYGFKQVAAELLSIRDRQLDLANEVAAQAESRPAAMRQENWAARQIELIQETARVGDRLSDRKASQWALDGARDSMARASRRLDANDPGLETRRLQEQAANRLEMVARSLAAWDHSPHSTYTEESDAGENGSANSETDSEAETPLDAAELRLIRDLQVDLAARFQKVGADYVTGEWTTEQREELRSLSREQINLARLLRTMSERKPVVEETP